MAIKFKKGKDVRKRHLVIVLYGPPSVGKTSIGLTASRPKLLDADGGSHRAPIRFRFDDDMIAEVNVWDDISNPEPSDFAGSDTAVVDTAGGLLDKIAAHIIRSDPKRGSSGTLDLKGYGILKGAFVGWLNRLRECGVDVVLLAHGAEEQRGDDMVDRIIAAGSSKQEIYQQADLIGRMYVESDGARWVAFDPTAGSFGKNCGMEKRRLVDPLQAPTQLADIVNEARVRINEAVLDDQDEVVRLTTLQQWAGQQNTPQLMTAAVRRALDPAKPAADADKRILWEHAKRLGFHFSRTAQSFHATEAEAAAAKPDAPAPAPQPVRPATQAADPPPPTAPPAQQPPPGVRVGVTAQPRAQRVPVPQADPPSNEKEAAAALQGGPAALQRPIGGGEDPAASEPVTDPDQPEIW